MTNIDLTPEAKVQYQQIAELRKQYCDLFSRKHYMLSNERDLLYTAYLNAIGQEQLDVLIQRTELSALKLKVAKLQAAYNRNEPVNLERLENEIKEQLSAYYEQISTQAENLRIAHEMQWMSDEESKELKDLYYMLVKRLHPDLNPTQTEYEADLFLKAQTAYKMKDLPILREIALSLELKRDTLSLGTIDKAAYITKLKKQVEEISKQIDQLNAEFPFSFRNQLLDDEWIRTEKERLANEKLQLQEDTRKYQDYYNLLSECIQKL